MLTYKLLAATNLVNSPHFTSSEQISALVWNSARNNLHQKTVSRL